MKKNFVMVLAATSMLFCSSFTSLYRPDNRVVVIKDQLLRTYSVTRFSATLNHMSQFHGKITVSGTSCQVMEQDNKTELFSVSTHKEWDKMLPVNPMFLPILLFYIKASGCR